MWPSKKNKRVKMPQEKNLEIGFGVEWRRDKEEVVVTTDKEKFVLNGKNELFLEISSNNIEPIKVKIEPDFKKRVINVVEVIDVNAKSPKDENKGKISLVGIYKQKNDIISIDGYLKKWDEQIEIFGKKMYRYKIRRNIFIIFGIVAIVGNAYLITISNSPMIYLNMVAMIIMTYTLFRLLNAYRDMFRSYEELKEQRSKAFEVVKNV